MSLAAMMKSWRESNGEATDVVGQFIYLSAVP